MEAGETLDFSAQVSSSNGGDQLVMKLFRDGERVAKSYQDGSTSPNIDDLSAVILYRGIVEDTFSTFKFCMRGDAPIQENRLQWGY